MYPLTKEMLPAVFKNSNRLNLEYVDIVAAAVAPPLEPPKKELVVPIVFPFRYENAQPIVASTYLSDSTR